MNPTLRPFYPWEIYPVSIIEEVGLVPAPVWIGSKNLDPNDIRSPDCPSQSDSPSLPTCSHRNHICWIEAVLETGYIYKTSVNFYQTARRHSREDSSFYEVPVCIILALFLQPSLLYWCQFHKGCNPCNRGPSHPLCTFHPPLLRFTTAQFMIFWYALSRHCIKGDANPDRTFWRAWASKLRFM
jgi:hypothetical protein